MKCCDYPSGGEQSRRHDRQSLVEEQPGDDDNSQNAHENARLALSKVHDHPVGDQAGEQKEKPTTEGNEHPT